MRNYILSLLSVFGFASNALASDFPANIYGNRQVIQELLKHGTNPSKLHPLEHHFYSSSHESLKALMKKGEGLGYRPANFGEGNSEGKKYWYGDLIKETKLDLNLINKENSLMLSLASEFKAEYDGWGTPIIQ
jgi:regulator of ribonuclease activity B